MGLLRTLLFVFFTFLIAGQTSYAGPEPSRVALFSLRPTTMDAMKYSGEVLYSLISSLDQNEDVSLMSRRTMEEKLYQAGLGQGDSQKLAQKAGKVLGVEFVLYGQVSSEGENIHVRLNLLDVRHNDLIKSWSIPLQGLQSIPKEMSKLAQGISLATRVPASVHHTETQPATDSVNQMELKHFTILTEKNAAVLSWVPPDNVKIEKFRIYRSTSPDGPFQFIAGETAQQFVDHPGKKDTNYWYRIGLILESGKEVPASPVVQYTAQLRDNVPHPPLILSSEGKVKRTVITFVPSMLNEKESMNISQYTLYKKNKQDWKKLAVVSAKRSTALQPSLRFDDLEADADGQTYTYAITSMDSNNQESDLSDPIQITTVPRPELSVTKDDKLRRIELSWKPLENITGYILYRKSKEEPWEKVTTIRNKDITSYVDKDRFHLEDGVWYTYRLTAFDSRKETDPSNPVSAKTKDLPPPPENLEAEGGMVREVTLTWSPVEDPDADGYIIYRGEDYTSMSMIARIKDRTRSTYADKSKLSLLPPITSALKDGQEYYYAMTTFNKFGAESELSPPVKAATKPPPPPVSEITAVAGKGHIFLSWTGSDAPGIVHYILFRSINEGAWAKLDTLDPGQNTYQDWDIRPDVKYRYKILVEDLDGLQSKPSRSSIIPSPEQKEAP